MALRGRVRVVRGEASGGRRRRSRPPSTSAALRCEGESKAFDLGGGGWYTTAVMYAIIEADGKQVRVAQGDTIRCDSVGHEVGAQIAFERVVLASSDAGGVSVGRPLVAGARVLGTVLRQAKDKKILVFKYKPKKRVRKLVGHRQRFAEVRIESIELPA